jgi:hypothetical protein
MNFNTVALQKEHTEEAKRKTNNIYALILLSYNVDKFRFKTTKQKNREIVGKKLKIRE